MSVNVLYSCMANLITYYYCIIFLYGGLRRSKHSTSEFLPGTESWEAKLHARVGMWVEIFHRRSHDEKERVRRYKRYCIGQT